MRFRDKSEPQQKAGPASRKVRVFLWLPVSLPINRGSHVYETRWLEWAIIEQFSNIPSPHFEREWEDRAWAESGEEIG